MEQNTNNNKKELGIEVPKEVATGTYANLAIISHSSSEFIIDFARILPAMPKAILSSRVIMTPENAKQLLIALNDNIKKFESQFGEIRTKQEKITIPMGFGPNTPKA
ncbi:MAG: DUF3467 domain-containing protein [Bacteroidales bacterium]|nr:DUF3467 domain-containing protein [Bacteroidales bacterium]MDY5823574.1 DUF3467 domain-containing protein [Candidatus Coprenecus sp.]